MVFLLAAVLKVGACSRRAEAVRAYFCFFYRDARSCASLPSPRSRRKPARARIVPVQRVALRSDDARRAAHLAAAYAPPPQRLSELDSAQRDVALLQLTAPRQIAFPSEGSRTRTWFSRPATAAQACPQQRRQALHVVG